MIKLCKLCHEKKNSRIKNPNYPICLYGYHTILLDNCYKCPYDKCEHHIDGNDYSLIDIDITEEDFETFIRVSNDCEFIDAMINLKQTDPIEYGIKMAKIRPAAEQAQKMIDAEEERKTEERNNSRPKCPMCGSTNIQVVPRKWSLLTGFLTNKTDRVCANCKHKF